MQTYRFDSFNNGSNGRSPFNLGSILVGIIALLLIFVVARFIFRLLYLLSPILLVATAIMDHKVITGYAGWLVQMVRRNTLLGIGAMVLTIVGFPIVTAALFGKALLNRQVRKAREAYEQQQQTPQIGEYVDFEELPDDSLRLPKFEQPKETPRKKDNEYDQFFK